MAKYDRIGRTYDLTRSADPYLVSRMINLLQPQAGEQFLDIGCGTGNYTIELLKSGVALIGIDPSDEMLDKARSRSISVDWMKGRAEDLDIADESQDGVLAWLTTHHWTDLEMGFSEISRVLRPSGRLLLFTSTPEQMQHYWLHHYFPEMMAASGNKMQSKDILLSRLSKAGFTLSKAEPYEVREDLQDLFLQCGKNDPEIYFRSEIRQGISSFADVANRDEVERGLSRLRTDIDNGRFESIAKNYNNDELGDYLFLLVTKRIR